MELGIGEKRKKNDRESTSKYIASMQVDGIKIYIKQ
jgi:hypothetical protein